MKSHFEACNVGGRPRIDLVDSEMVYNDIDDGAIDPQEVETEDDVGPDTNVIDSFAYDGDAVIDDQGEEDRRSPRHSAS